MSIGIISFSIAFALVIASAFLYAIGTTNLDWAHNEPTTTRMVQKRARANLLVLMGWMTGFMALIPLLVVYFTYA